MASLRGIFVLDEEAFDLVYGPRERRDIERLIDVVAPVQTRQSIAARSELLKDVDVLLTGWGAPQLTHSFLAAAPKLKGVFYGAGSLATLLTDAVWERGLVVTSAITANSVPVAEYTLATILFSLKHGWRLAQAVRETQSFVERNQVPGAYQRTVGLVSLGTVARLLIDLLRPFDLDIIAYDPFCTAASARKLGVTLVPLEEVFAKADVVSLHAPCLPETIGMIDGSHFAAMKPGATFINTARAEIVCQNEMIDVAMRRADLQFVLDVTAPEPPEPGSPLYTLPNVMLTPHIAGSAGTECRRMGRYMVQELERFIAGDPLKWAVSPDSIWHTSHRPLSARKSRPDGDAMLQLPQAGALSV
ncbi:MAG: hydroxyacid dehydrogenase [Tepidisphaeraceae bacterium]